MALNTFSMGLLLITLLAVAKSDEILSESVKKLLGHVTHDGLTFKKCCSLNETYTIGPETCKTLPSNELPSLNSEIFAAFASKTQCPIGQVPSTAKIAKVNITKNGLYSASGAFLSGDYCVDEFRYHAGEDVDYLITRFCADDPCTKSDCVRKCCPVGMVLNQELGACQERNVAFDLDGTIANLTSGTIVRDGVFPDCPHGTYALENDEFTIQSNGSIVSVEHMEHDNNSDHCIDNLVNFEGNLVLGALKCFPHPIAVDRDDEIALNIYPYALFFSSIFLIATFVIYAILPDLHNTQGLMIMAYSASMSVMFVGLGTIQISPGMSNVYCIGSAIIVHYTFLATFTWLNALSFDIWHSLSHTRSTDTHKEKRRFVFYSLYAWGVPAVIVILGQILDNVRGLPSWVIQPQFGLTKCFFSARSSYFAYLYGPVSVLLLANLFFFVASSVTLCMRPRETTAHQHHTKKGFFTILTLFFVMGVTWITEVLSFIFDNLSYLWIPLDILNIANGVFVFIIFVCRRHVWKLLVRNYPKIKALSKLCPCCCRSRRSVDLPQTCAEKNDDETLGKSQQTTI